MNIKTFVEQSEREFDEKFGKDKEMTPVLFPYAPELKSFTSSKLRELIGEVRKITDTLLHYVEHDSLCIRAKQNAGRPTEDGGYEEKFGDIWYESRPVDKTPECDCGLESVLHLLDETK